MAHQEPEFSAALTHALTDAVLVQASANELDKYSELADQAGCGLVVTGKDAIGGLRTMRQAGMNAPVLVDRRRYAGKRRMPGTAPLTASWLQAQYEAGATAILTDSGYVGCGDEPALDAVLSQTAAYQRRWDGKATLWAVLPLHQSWLRGQRATLTGYLRQYRVPVALVLEHATDPLGTQVAVQGLVKVLDAPVPVALLCTDVSALGALAFGAVFAAVGVRTSLRHLYPQTENGPRPTGVTSTLVDPVLSIVSTNKIATAYAASPDDQVWQCCCEYCHGRDLTWLATAGQVQANHHTFTALLARREEMELIPRGDRRRRWWRSCCSDALWNYDALQLVERHRWTVPGFLKAWDAG
ncbi:hypothetical protein GCM10009678_04920 [Actinomadura kijaniata]|uniref:Uncharacterized protein n=1 Tax=Actinomadura namibiensis TaxID=182080 RepID=A0A7W3LTC8_ACTNM|nr:hypothetical protein [Actinomadura namibiensis]MBA8953944.1 hypothetical protein [Actinomadura namibiensis]